MKIILSSIFQKISTSSYCITLQYFLHWKEKMNSHSTCCCCCLGWCGQHYCHYCHDYCGLHDCEGVNHHVPHRVPYCDYHFIFFSATIPLQYVSYVSLDTAHHYPKVSNTPLPCPPPYMMHHHHSRRWILIVSDSPSCVEVMGV